MATRSVQITERDRELLRFAAEHRFVLADHVRALLGMSSSTASTRLRALMRAGLLRREAVFDRQPACYQTTRAGHALIGSTLRAPRLDLRSYEHDAGLVWLALAARHGAFGAVREVLTERQLRSRDTLMAVPRELGDEDGWRPLAVRLGGVGPSGRERLHYPDLLLETASGHRVAVELELSAKGRVRQEKILAGYAGDPRIDAVLYLVSDKALARQLQGSARKLGISRMVHVQSVELSGATGRSGGGIARRRAAGRDRAQARELVR